MSLLFGVAQVVVGAAVAVRLLPRKPWRFGGQFLLLLICLWFLCSGFAELAVSGMEVARALGGAPSAQEFVAWRGRFDALLLVATAALAVALLVRAVLARVLPHLAAPPGGGRQA